MGDVDWIGGAIQRAVDSVLDHHIRIASLDVNVRGSSLERVEHNRIDEFYDGRHLFVASQAFEIQHLLALLSLSNQRHSLGSETGSRVLQYARGGITTFQRLLNRALGRERGLQPNAQLGFNFVYDFEIGWIGHRDKQYIALAVKRHEAVPHHQL